MIKSEDAVRMLDVVAKNLLAVSKSPSNFERLPDSFWGYFAKGHDSNGKFAVIITYSEAGDDVDWLLRSYEQWVAKNKAKSKSDELL
ncbi:MAG TPA: hypothetical protein VJP79_11855 [Nitrososphaera sp.]|nr:hypothetical protein [Nitrososphaera sp.]